MTMLGTVADVLAVPAILSLAGLAVAWLVYPAAMALIGRARRTPAPADPDAQPMVSIVMATRAPRADIRARVLNLLETRHPAARLELIIAHDRATERPDLSDLPESSPAITFVEADEPGGKASSLNAGVRAATGDCIVFADTYQLFDRDTIPRLVAALARPGIVAATGSYELAPGSNGAVALYWRFEKWLRRTEARVHSPTGATGAVYAIRRSAWTPLPAGLILDDVYGPMRIILDGGRVAFVDDARARETRTPTPRQEYTRKVRTLTGVIQTCMWLPDLLIPGRNPIWIQFMCHKLLRLLTPYFALFAGLWAVVIVISVAPPVVPVIGAAFVAALVLMIALSPRSRLRTIFAEGILMQAAAIVAGFNGLRRNWQVWDA